MAGITAEYEGNINIKSGDNQGATVRSYTAVCGNYYSISRDLYGEKNEQPKTDGQWMESHCWSVVNNKDLHPDSSHQDLDTELSCCN